MSGGSASDWQVLPYTWESDTSRAITILVCMYHSQVKGFGIVFFVLRAFIHELGRM